MRLLLEMAKENIRIFLSVELESEKQLCKRKQNFINPRQRKPQIADITRKKRGKHTTSTSISVISVRKPHQYWIFKWTASMSKYYVTRFHLLSCLLLIPGKIVHGGSAIENCIFLSFFSMNYVTNFPKKRCKKTGLLLVSPFHFKIQKQWIMLRWDCGDYV